VGHAATTAADLFLCIFTTLKEQKRS